MGFNPLKKTTVKKINFKVPKIKKARNFFSTGNKASMVKRGY